MPASKKSASKTASAKKSSKKATAVATQKIEFALSAERIAAIKKCLAKGTLRVTVSKADLLKGRVRDPWLYD
jgi:anti-sigma28 factor (negative regulator of flagellin synthesis)